VCPGSLNGVVSLKPTTGLLSRTHIVPISHTQDTPGPMARNVRDVADLLTIMAGSDAADPMTADAAAHKADYAAALDGASLKGKRLGVIAPDPSAPPSDTAALFARTVTALKAAGAEIVEIKDFTPPPPNMSADELTILKFEMKADLNTCQGEIAGRRHRLQQRHAQRDAVVRTGHSGSVRSDSGPERSRLYQGTGLAAQGRAGDAGQDADRQQPRCLDHEHR
jgi:Asp-tRNA(Asn)/Glu-tRNA(Gln) amidotransferase A subunit family amidase